MCSNKYFVDDGSEYIESLKRHERYNCSLSRTYGAHPAYVSVSLVFVSALRREVFAKWTPLFTPVCHSRDQYHIPYPDTSYASLPVLLRIRTDRIARSFVQKTSGTRAHENRIMSPRHSLQVMTFNSRGTPQDTWDLLDFQGRKLSSCPTINDSY